MLLLRSLSSAGRLQLVVYVCWWIPMLLYLRLRSQQVHAVRAAAACADSARGSHCCNRSQPLERGKVQIRWYERLLLRLFWEVSDVAEEVKKGGGKHHRLFVGVVVVCVCGGVAAYARLPHHLLDKKHPYGIIKMLPRRVQLLAAARRAAAQSVGCCSSSSWTHGQQQQPAVAWPQLVLQRALSSIRAATPAASGQAPDSLPDAQDVRAAYGHCAQLVRCGAHTTRVAVGVPARTSPLLPRAQRASLCCVCTRRAVTHSCVCAAGSMMPTTFSGWCSCPRWVEGHSCSGCVRCRCISDVAGILCNRM